MAILFDPNVVKSASLRAGFGLWRIKELLVLTGRWAVIGTGDGGSRYAYRGVTGALSVPQQGSGGIYDCLKTGVGAGTLVAGDWSTAGWCVVEDETGRQILLVDSNGTPDGSWNSYGRVAYSRLAGFDGAAASATTIPAAASDEQWIWGNRATPVGVEIFDYNTAGYIHFYAHDTATDGVAGFGWLSASTAGTPSIHCAFSALRDYDSNALGDPSCWIKGNSVSAWTVYGSAYASWDTSLTLANPVQSTFPVEPQGGGKDPLTRAFGLSSASGSDSAITTADMGYPIDVVVDRFTSTRAHPDLLDAGTSVWLVQQSSSFAMPWPSTATAPLSGTGTTRSCTLYSPPSSTRGKGVVPVSQELIPVAHYQRVWDVINARWCYYTKSVVDPSPSTSDTSPVHSGSINGHSVLQTRVG
jgi:hypothetical protein